MCFLVTVDFEIRFSHSHSSYPSAFITRITNDRFVILIRSRHACLIDCYCVTICLIIMSYPSTPCTESALSPLSNHSRSDQAAIMRFEQREVVLRCLARAEEISIKHLPLAREDVEQIAWQTIIHAHCQFASHFPSLVDDVLDQMSAAVSVSSHSTPMPHKVLCSILRAKLSNVSDLVVAPADASSAIHASVQAADDNTPTLFHPFQQPSSPAQLVAHASADCLSIPATSIKSPGRPTDLKNGALKDGARLDLDITVDRKPTDVVVFVADQIVSDIDCSVSSLHVSQPASGSACSVDSWTAELMEISCGSGNLSTSASPLSEKECHDNEDDDESIAAESDNVASVIVDDKNTSPRSLVRSAACSHLDLLCYSDAAEEHMNGYGSDWHWVQSLMLIAAC